MSEPTKIAIRPLTFWDTYRSAGVILMALTERSAAYQAVGSRPVLRLALRAILLPVFNHLATSGYGAFVEDHLAGWLYLSGRQGTQYVSILAVHPEWRRRGIGRALMAFAEDQARALKRKWLVLDAVVENAPAISLYEGIGFRRAPWRLYRCLSNTSLPVRTEGIRLRRLIGPSAWRAHQRITVADLEAGDAWGAAILSRFLFEDPARWLGRRWLAMAEGKPDAYVCVRGPRTHPSLYLAAPGPWWGTPEALAAIAAALGTLGKTPPGIDLSLGSTGHHDAAREALQSLGFVEQPAQRMKLLKPLGEEG